MKAKFKSAIRAACHSFSGAVRAGSVMLIASSAQAQNLFVASVVPASDGASYIGIITEITEGGMQSAFASGLTFPQGLAFDSAGELFEADYSGHVYEFTPAGARSTFASGLSTLYGLAFNSAGDLFATDSGNIYEWTPEGGAKYFCFRVERSSWTGV